MLQPVKELALEPAGTRSAKHYRYDSMNRLVQVKSHLGAGNFHGPGGVKDAILKDLSTEILKQVGKNPDIYVNRNGLIQVVSTLKKGVSFITDLNIDMYS